MENLDKELRKIELEIKKKELLLKEKDIKKNIFFTPITVPLYLGIISFIASLIINFYNNRQQTKIEKQRFEYSLYLNALNNTTQNLAIEQLKFYRDLGLIKDFNLKIQARIENKQIPITKSDNHFRKNQLSENVFVLKDVTYKNMIDTIGIVSPLSFDDGMECVGNEEFQIKFKNSNIPNIIISGLGYIIFIDNIIDVNNDGLNEILVVKSGLNGCWWGAYLYSFQNAQWNQSYLGAVYGCNGDEDYSSRIIRREGKYYFLMDGLDDNFLFVKKEKEITSN